MCGNRQDLFYKTLNVIFKKLNETHGVQKKKEFVFAKKFLVSYFETEQITEQQYKYFSDKVFDLYVKS